MSRGKFATFLVALASLSTGPAAIAAQTDSTGNDGAAAFIRMCGDTGGNIPAALAAAQASSWTPMTPAQMGMDASPFRRLEIRRGGRGEESLFMLVTESLDAQTQMLAKACAILVYPAADGETVPDPTPKVAAWVGVPAETNTEQPGLTVFMFSGGEVRRAVDPAEGSEVARLAEQGLLHGVAVIYDPRKVMIQYTTSTPENALAKTR